MPKSTYGGMAQLARAPALQAGGQRFESAYLHQDTICGNIVRNFTPNTE